MRQKVSLFRRPIFFISSIGLLQLMSGSDKLCRIYFNRRFMDVSLTFQMASQDAEEIVAVEDAENWWMRQNFFPIYFNFYYNLMQLQALSSIKGELILLEL